jgi:hypothetical protein
MHKKIRKKALWKGIYIYKKTLANVIRNVTILFGNKVKIEWYLINNIPN